MLKSNFINNKIIVEGFSEDLLGVISHDLTIRKIIIPNIKEEVVNYDIKSNETVFIDCEQVIDLPSDMIGIVHGKNSRIRQGLNLISPIYQPGHKTRIFFRVTNISSDVITLNKGDKIAQISFDKAIGDEKLVYNGTFQNEFEYRGLGNYENKYKK